MPFSKITLEEDEAIKRLSSDQGSPKRFKWEESLGDKEATEGSVRLHSDKGEEVVELSDIANTVGNALANLLFSKGEKDVFNSENKDFVAKVARTVGQRFRDDFSAKALGKYFSTISMLLLFYTGVPDILSVNFLLFF